MNCGCIDTCGCWIGEGIRMYRDMVECYENIVWLQAQPTTPENLRELDDTWRALFSAEGEIGQYINDFIAEDPDIIGPKIYPPQHLMRGNRMPKARKIKLLKMVMDAVLVANQPILETKKARWGGDNIYHHHSNLIHDPHYAANVWCDLRFIIESLKA